MTYYRTQSADRNTADLLDPAKQLSYAWSDETNVRHGISVFDSIEGLATYLAASGIEFRPDWVLITLDGPLADDKDHDAHLGADLIRPEVIIDVEPITARLLPLIDAAWDASQAA